MTIQTKMTDSFKSGEHGVALLFCLFALLILTALTTSLILLSGTETAVNANYRSEEVSFFAAKSGIYEALDRMQQPTDIIHCVIPTNLPGAVQTVAPGCLTAPAAGVLYIINAGSSLTVKPWDPTNTYFDDEFCHEGYSIAGMTSTPPDVPCTTVPTGTAWYTPPVASNYPWSGTAAAIPYEWVRINWKLNSSEAYLSGGPSSPTISTYSVNSTGTSTTPACWNGSSQILLSTPAGVTPNYTSCQNYQSCGTTQQTVTTPVLMITALAITSNGSRQMVQAEAAQAPPTLAVTPGCVTNPGDPYGFFAYGSTCTSTAVAFTIGGNASVDGYNSSNGTYAATKSASLGSIGTNGGLIEMGTSTKVGGTVYAPNPGIPPYKVGCPAADYDINGNGTNGGVATSNVLAVPTVIVPAAGATAKSFGKSGGTLAPGNYGDVSLKSGGTLTLTAPGTYNINCLDVQSAGSTVTISPAGKKVVINVTGTADSGCTNGPIFFAANSLINNSSGVSSNLTINYAGTGTLTFTGGASTYAIVNAPNSAVVLHGGNDYFGTIMANTIDDSGGVNLHFDAADKNLNSFTVTPTTLTATATGHYNSLAFKSLPY